MSLPRSKGRPTRKIITNHFVQAEKVQNSSNRHFFKCNYCSKSIESRDDKPLKHILNRNACPTAPDHAETLPVSAERCPLKAFAIIIHSIVPHAADVERYFSGLGGVQSVKRCNLSVETFESLSKLRASYANFLHKVDQDAGKAVRRKHAHMHTQPERGLDTALADQLQRSFAWVPPLAGNSHTDSDDEFLAGPESITDEELLDEFARFEHEMQESRARGALPEGRFAGDIIDWNELEKVDKGIEPAGFVEEIDVVSCGSQGMEAGWNINALLTSEGVASMY